MTSSPDTAGTIDPTPTWRTNIRRYTSMLLLSGPTLGLVAIAIFSGADLNIWGSAIAMLGMIALAVAVAQYRYTEMVEQQLADAREVNRKRMDDDHAKVMALLDRSTATLAASRAEFPPQ